MAVFDPTRLVTVVATSIRAFGGADCAAPLDATVAASDSARPASGAVTWPAGGTDCATPSDATAATSGYSWLGVATAACSTTTEGTDATTGAAGPANETTTSAPLLPETGATPGSAIRPV